MIRILVVSKAVFTRLTPTELPRKKRVMHRVGKELAKQVRSPNTAVKKSVALKAVLLPITSEPAFEVNKAA